MNHPLTPSALCWCSGCGEMAGGWGGWGWGVAGGGGRHTAACGWKLESINKQWTRSDTRLFQSASADPDNPI